MDLNKLQSVRDRSDAWLADTFSLGSFHPERQPSITICPSETVTKVQAGVSPDCSYRLVKAALEAARESILLYIYNASADHLLDLLREAGGRSVKIQVMYDVTDTRGNERQKLADLGVELKEAPSSGGRKVFTVCHQKFAVIDGAILLLGSANWAGTSIPKITLPGRFKKGNREWLVRIDDLALASWFRELFQADWDIPKMETPHGLVLEPDLRPDSAYVPNLLADLPECVFDILAVDLPTPVKVTPLISPLNYYEQVLNLILNARRSVDIEQQYILAGGPKTEGLLQALELRRSEIEIRIIVSPAFRKEGDKDNWELSKDSLDAFHLKDCLRAMNLNYYTHLHNKGLIIDREKVVVSSTNWSENSIARAREAGVLIDSPVVAGFFAGVFDYDWSTAWDQASVPDNIARLFAGAAFVPGGFEEVHPADLV